MRAEELGKIEDELVYIILIDGKDKKLPLEDLYLAWTWNVGDKHEYTEKIESIHLETDCNGASVVFIDFEHDSLSLNELNNYDSECLKYIYNEITMVY